MLFNKTQESNQKSDEVLVPVQNIIEKEQLRKELLSKQKELTKEEYKELAAGSPDNQDNYIKLFQNSISFQSAMKNFDDVLDKYLENKQTPTKDLINVDDNPYSLPVQNVYGKTPINFQLYKLYRFKDGVLYL